MSSTSSDSLMPIGSLPLQPHKGAEPYGEALLPCITIRTTICQVKCAYHWWNRNGRVLLDRMRICPKQAMILKAQLSLLLIKFLVRSSLPIPQPTLATAST
eukprot:648242-Amphidinium_carterae.1